MKKKILALAVLAALGLGVATSASAYTTAGTVTVTGTAVINCTVTSPAVNMGAAVPAAVPGGYKVPATIDISCPAGVPWSMGASIVNQATVGANTSSNYLYLLKADDTQISAGVPITGTGTGAAQSQSLQVQLKGSAAGQAIVGTGAISGTIPFTLTY